MSKPAFGLGTQCLAETVGTYLLVFFGWGSVALPGPRGLGFLTVNILAPIVGAVTGACLCDFALRAPANHSTVC